MIDGNVLPIASTGVAPSARIAGVETTAPPTPNMPGEHAREEPGDQDQDGLERFRQEHRHYPGPSRYPVPMANDLQLRGVYIPLITPFAADGSVALDAVDAALPRVPRRGCHRHRRARAPPAKRRALDCGREARGHRRVRDGLQRAGGAAHRRCRDQQHRDDGRRGRGARGNAGARRDAHRRAVLRAAVGSRDRRALPGGRRREPGAARALQHRDAHRSPPRCRGRARGRRSTRTSPGIKQAATGLDARHARAARRRAGRLRGARRRGPVPVPARAHGRRGRDLRVGARLHRALRRDDRVRARGQGRRRPRARRGAAARRAVAVRRAEPRGVQGRAARAGPHPDARRAPAAAERERRRRSRPRSPRCDAAS